MKGIRTRLIGFGFRGIGLGIALVLAFLSAGRFSATTPKGLQCPTAPVQEILSKSAEGVNQTTAVSARAPVPGDADFVQCQCAEKTKVKGAQSIDMSVDFVVLAIPKISIPSIVETGESFLPPHLARAQSYAPVLLRPPAA